MEHDPGEAVEVAGVGEVGIFPKTGVGFDSEEVNDHTAEKSREGRAFLFALQGNGCGADGLIEPDGVVHPGITQNATAPVVAQGCSRKENRLRVEAHSRRESGAQRCVLVRDGRSDCQDELIEGDEAGRSGDADVVGHRRGSGGQRR